MMSCKGGEAIARVERVVAMAMMLTVKGEEVVLGRPPWRFCDGHGSASLWVVGKSER